MRTKLSLLFSPRRISLFVAGLLLLAMTLLLLVRASLYQPNNVISEAVVFAVQPGSSLTRVSQDLNELGLVSNAGVFRLLARWQGQANGIRVGEYEITPGMSAADILQLLVSGQSIQYRITFVEGWTFEQALQALAELDNITHTVSNLSTDAMRLALGLENSVLALEGMLHPDTYFYTRDTTDLELLQRARRRQEEILADAWANRLGALPYASAYESLIMASIIEKESGIASEREKIAGVFVRRLELGMRLQSDPTVIYGLGDEYAGNLTRTHLQTTTAYNTYRINGLPPTPIALPGAAAISAALNPEESDALYFVATGDGGHYFSASLAEHNEAVERFQRQPARTRESL